MNVLIRKNDADLVIEVTPIDPTNGNGIDLTGGGAAIKVSAEIMSGIDKYWNSGTSAFDLGAEPALDPMVYVRSGLHELVLTGAADALERGYRIRVQITNAQLINLAYAVLNTDALFSGTVLADETTGGDATAANQAAIAAQNATIIGTGGAGPWTTASVPGAVDLNNNPTNLGVIGEGVWNTQRSSWPASGTFGEYVNSNVIRWANSATIDGVSLTKFNKILLAYVAGRFKINEPSAGYITFYEQDKTTVLYVMSLTTTDRTPV